MSVLVNCLAALQYGQYGGRPAFWNRGETGVRSPWRRSYLVVSIEVQSNTFMLTHDLNELQLETLWIELL